MTPWVIRALVAILCLISSPSDARRIFLTPEQRSQLAHVQTIWVHVLALTEKGPADPRPLNDLIKQRFEEVGFATITDGSQPHDIEFKVKCEERKTWAGTTPSGGDAELPDAPSRLWKGPACLLSYLIEKQDLEWYREVRTDFENTNQNPQIAGGEDFGILALHALTIKLEVYDFPVLLIAEWGQTNRLLQLLNSSNTPRTRKLLILSVLGEHPSPEIIPHLTALIHDPVLAPEAIGALGRTGPVSLPILVDLLDQATEDRILVAVAKALGKIGALSGDVRIIPPLHKYLNKSLETLHTSQDINFPVLTEVVWALGMLPDNRTIAPMESLQKKVWVIHDTSVEMTQLREAVNWTYKQVAEAGVADR